MKRQNAAKCPFEVPGTLFFSVEIDGHGEVDEDHHNQKNWCRYWVWFHYVHPNFTLSLLSPGERSIAV